MKITGIGIDIVEVKRIKRLWEKFGNTFLNKVFHKKELDYCLKMKQPELHLAARFAAKEAVVKALGTGMQGFSWKDFEISRKVSGEPTVKLSVKAKKYLKSIKGTRVYISLSHCESYATAQALVA